MHKLLIWTLLLWALTGQCGEGAMELFVAVHGHDGWPGTRTQPLATLAGARDAIRALKKKGPLPHGEITVWVHGGRYPLEQTFALTEQDAGTPETPIVYRAIEGAQVRLQGGKRVTDFAPVTDPAVLERLDPAARPHVRQADLRKLGITDFGALHTRGFGRKTTPAHLELFFQGERMTLARWPNEGYTTITGFPAGAGANDGHGTDIGKLEAGFHYEGDRPARWKNTGDLWAHGYWSWDWANSYEHIANIDTERKLITTAEPYGLYGFRAGQRVYYLNILEELDSPGEYYLDRESGTLYFWPPEPIAGSKAFVSLLETPLVTLTNVSYVTLRGFTLEYARGSGIAIRGGAACTVGGCTLRNLGTNAVTVEGGHGHLVAGCDITHTGDGGITLSGGDRKTLTPGGHAAVNNHIYDIAQWSRCYQPAVLIYGVGNRAAHNLIHDHPHCAILISGNEHVIEYNDIHHVALETGDVGAFYIGRDYTAQGNIVRYNFFHELGGVGMGSMAVYLDDCASGVTIFGNVFYKTKWAAFIGGGRDNIVDNNIFVQCHPAVHLDGRGLDPSPVWHGMVYDTMKKSLEAMDYRRPPYSERYPTLAAIAEEYDKGTQGIPPAGNVARRNISVDSQWLELTWHATKDMINVRDNLVDVDPHFVDPAHLNFQLKDTSPAYALGFQRLPLEQIGLMRDDYRRE